MKVFMQAIWGQLLLTPYIYWRGKQALPPSKQWRLPYTMLFLLEWLLYFTGYIFYNVLPDEVFIPIMNICNSWYIASIYLTMGLLFLEVIRFMTQTFLHFQAKYPLKLFLFFSFIFGVSILLWKAHRNVTDPIVIHQYIDLPKGSSSRDSLKIVMATDIHIGEVIRKRQVEKLVSLSNTECPDMVVFVGDLIDYESRFAENEHIENVFKRLNAPLGVYSTFGNHEYRANRISKERWIRKFSILLKDSVISPDDSFYLVGRDDAVNKKRKTLHKLIAGIDTTKPIIVLDHQPFMKFMTRNRS